MKFSVSLALAASLSLMVAGASNATSIIHYTFSDDAFYDYFSPLTNTPVTGSFDFDTAAGVLSNVNYTSVSGTFTTGSEYNSGDATLIYFGLFGGNYDVYQLASSLTGGGTIAITAAFHPSIPITAGGSLISGAAGGIPEPAAWAVMLVGFGGIGSLLRRRRARVALAA